MITPTQPDAPDPAQVRETVDDFRMAVRIQSNNIRSGLSRGPFLLLSVDEGLAAVAALDAATAELTALRAAGDGTLSDETLSQSRMAAAAVKDMTILRGLSDRYYEWAMKAKDQYQYWYLIHLVYHAELQQRTRPAQDASPLHCDQPAYPCGGTATYSTWQCRVCGDVFQTDIPASEGNDA